MQLTTSFRGGPLDGLQVTWNYQPPWVVYMEPPKVPQVSEKAFDGKLTMGDAERIEDFERYELVGNGCFGSDDSEDSIKWTFWHESRNDAIPSIPSP